MPLLVHTVMPGEEACSILPIHVVESQSVLPELEAAAREAQALMKLVPVLARQHRVAPAALA